jgi:hypothetical protein
MLFYQAYETYTTGVVSRGTRSYVSSNPVRYASGTALFALVFLGIGWYAWWEDE